jgi:hypothetical protein
VIREAKKQCNSQLLASSENKIKIRWNIIKNETGKVCTSVPMIPIFINYDTVVKPEKVAEAFNNLFLTVTDSLNSLNLQSMKESSAISFLRHSYPNSFSKYENNPSNRSGNNRYNYP